ncbi:methyltransferase [Rhodococcus sp. Eu-32]|uniref:methyltransferase n=1 Tax=Rhodococcus sp. Eu-32 TaxID=1017319 RepID=UPI000F7AFFDA|nr:methyltransferase [Rhodococcus sp. Eu-32]RRQ26139.1 methyltransferase [Rhodococcus sp. Eu-32]
MTTEPADSATDPVADTGDGHFAVPPRHPHRSALLGVEIAALDQHGDPGFVHTRGYFYTHTTAARFAVTQADAVTALREVDEVAVTITRQGEGYTDTDVLVVGSAGEIACALAVIPEYIAGVRGAELPAPDYVQSAVAVVTAAWPPLPASYCPDDALEVHVRSVRPDPLPESRVVLGDYPEVLASEVAGELVEALIAAAPDRIEGAINEVYVRSLLVVAHSVGLSDTDTAAVERYEKITRLRANVAGLDPVSDASEIALLNAQLEPLLAASRRAAGSVDGAA